jgi:hypothetical protein
LTPGWRRALGLGGIGFAVAGAVCWLVAPLAMPEGAGALAAHYREHRGELILTSVVAVGGNALVAAWFVALAALVGGDGLGRILGRVGLVGMAIQIAALSAAFCAFAAVAYRQPAAETARFATDFGWLLINLAGGPVTSVAIVAFAFALRRMELGGGWLVPVSAVTAVAHLVVAASFADRGFFSPTGGVEITVPVVYFTWIAAVAAVIGRGR